MRFLLVCEDNSDTPLAAHIQRLLETFGHRQVAFDTSTYGRQLVDKVRNGLKLAPHYDLLFVHRDSDNARPEARYGEITIAVQDAPFDGPWVGIVPVRTTEAWLLLDETAIRKAIRKPNARGSLTLPTPGEIERRADPGEILATALLDASETRGRRREDTRRDLPSLRRYLLENLPVGGPLEQLPSWVRFRDDTVTALQALS